MSLLFIDGFSHYATADVTKKWESSGGIIQSSVVRYGASAISLASSSVSMWKNIPASASLVIGCAVRFSLISAGDLFMLFDAGTQQCELRVNGDGTLSVNRIGTSLTNGTSVSALSTNTWYFIEWKVTIADSIAAGSCKVRVNGVDWITVATGQDTKNTANASVNQFRIRGSGGSTSYYADLYLCDQVDSGVPGLPNNDFLGDVRVEQILVTGAGNSTGLTPSAGSNYQCVDEVSINSDTDYVSSAVAGTKDTYAFANLASSPVTVFGVQVLAGQRKDDAGSRTSCIVTRSGGADYDGSTYGVLDGYSYDRQVRQSDPATAVAWTQSGVNAAEFGVKVVS